MAEFDWNPFAGGGGEFVKFETTGDEVVGKIVNIRVHTFDPDKGAVPLIDLEPLTGGESVTLSVDKVDLRRKVSEIGPQVGDLLAVKLMGTQKAGAGMMKVFAVKHKRGERPVPEPEWDAEPAPHVAPVIDEPDLSEYSNEVF